MTTTTDKGKSLTDEELLAIVEAATPGTWEWWNGNSWWRLGSTDASFRGLNPTIVEPTKHWRDGHPDLIVRDEDKEFIATFDPPTVRSLIERARAAEKEAAIRIHAETFEALKTRLEIAEKDRDDWRDAWQALVDASNVDNQIHTQLFTAEVSAKQAAEARAIAAEEALKVEKGRANRTEIAFAWLTKNPNCELSHGYDNEDDGMWMVHRVNGGVNDREWTLISKDRTPLWAIERAMLADSMAARALSSTEAQS